MAGFGKMEGMEEQTEECPKKVPGPAKRGGWRRRKWWVVAFIAAVLFFASAPLTEIAVEHVLKSKLNDPEKGLSCREVSMNGFGYLKLLFKRDPGRVDIRGLRYSLEAMLPDGGILESREAEVDVTLKRREMAPAGRLSLSVKGRAFDWPLTASGAIDLSWSNLVTAAGSVRAELSDLDGGSPYAVTADFSASPSAWRADARIAEFELSSEDPVAGRLVSRLDAPAVSNLVFNGRVKLDVSAQKTEEVPVVAWTLRAPMRGFNAKLDLAGAPFELSGASVMLGASGIANHLDVEPVRLYMRALETSGFALTNAYASLRNEGRTLVVSEAGAGCCGGTVKLYSLSLDPEKLNAGFTLFVDDIDAGEALSHLNGFRGTATGRLHGKLPLSVRGGTKVRLRDAFLYSTPGETGNLKMWDSSLITDQLRLGGVPEETCGNLENALSNLDYTTLKLKFANEADGDALLTMKLAGTATRGQLTVPVDITVNFRGAIEQILNLGLKTASQL